MVRALLLKFNLPLFTNIAETFVLFCSILVIGRSKDGRQVTIEAFAGSKIQDVENRKLIKKIKEIIAKVFANDLYWHTRTSTIKRGEIVRVDCQGLTTATSNRPGRYINIQVQRNVPRTHAGTIEIFTPVCF